MTAKPSQLASVDLPNASASLYTSPTTGRGTWIDKATATNHSGGARTVTFNVVLAAGSPVGANLVVDGKSIADKATDLLPELVGHFLPPGASLYGLADTATSVALVLSGRELTA